MASDNGTTEQGVKILNRRIVTAQEDLSSVVLVYDDDGEVVCDVCVLDLLTGEYKRRGGDRLESAASVQINYEFRLRKTG